MSRLLTIHPENPQPRLVRQAVEVLESGGLIVYPTDSSYALGCHIGDKAAMERIRSIRQLDSKHHFTLVCRDLSEISTYAKVGNAAYRLLKTLTPGPYTFLLEATHDVPRRLQNPKRKTIGLRVPDNPIVHALLTEFGQPLMSSTLILPGETMPLADADDVDEQVGNVVDLVIDGGNCGIQPTTVVDMAGGTPVIARQGKGEVGWLDHHAG